jgi:hypothetical protein
MCIVLIHESKKVNRYAYYFIANADPSAIGAEVRCAFFLLMPLAVTFGNPKMSNSTDGNLIPI